METTKTTGGRRITMADVNAAMNSEDQSIRFPVNFALHQFGPRTARRIVALFADGHQVTVAQSQTCDGFIIDGAFRSWREV
jgi:hypothetical protein